MSNNKENSELRDNINEAHCPLPNRSEHDGGSGGGCGGGGGGCGQLRREKLKSE